MTTIEVSLGDARHIDSWVRRAYVEQADKESRILHFLQEFQLFFGREYGLKYEVLTYLRSLFSGFQYSLWRVPTSELFLRNIVRIDIQAIGSPFIV